jgi:hypothetical protein
MYSSEPPERLAIKGAMAGLLRYVCYESSYYSNQYYRKSGWWVFGDKEEETTTRHVKRLQVER